MAVTEQRGSSLQVPSDRRRALVFVDTMLRGILNKGPFSCDRDYWKGSNASRTRVSTVFLMASWLLQQFNHLILCDIGCCRVLVSYDVTCEPHCAIDTSCGGGCQFCSVAYWLAYRAGHRDISNVSTVWQLKMLCYRHLLRRRTTAVR